MFANIRPVIEGHVKNYIDNLPSENCLTKKKVKQIALISFALFTWTCSYHNSFYMAGAKTVTYLATQAVQLAVIPVFSDYTNHDGKLDPMTQSFKDITCYVTALTVMYGLTGTIPLFLGVAVLGNIIYNFSFDRRGTSNEHIRLFGPLVSLL